jgi:hypothetical protein
MMISGMDEKPAATSKKRKVREDTYSSTRKKKAAKKDNIIVLTSPKSLTSATITGEHDLTIGNIPRRKVPIASSATPMSVTASIPGGMSELNLTNNNLVTPSKESAVQPVSMVEDNNTNVNSPGCQSFESVPQCIFTTAASEMEIVHGNNNININAMQIVSPKDSSTVAIFQIVTVECYKIHMQGQIIQ